MPPRNTSLTILTLLAISCLCISLFKGNDAVSSAQLFSLFDGQASPLAKQIFVLIRLPHTLNAFVVGGLLALAGALLQTLLRNPLADPYILGVSSGSALATLLLMLAGVSGFGLTIGSWVGSLIAIAFILALAKPQHYNNPPALLLIGVALTSGLSAIISLLMLLTPNAVLRGMLFWLVGELNTTKLPLFAGCVLLAGLVHAIILAPQLNVLLRGDNVARTLGVNTRFLFFQLYFLTALLTATAVSVAGCIGFIGLIAPHIYRLIWGNNHQYLLPGCALLGGSLLTLADCIARNIAFPQELPAGLIMALLGAPVLVFILQRRA